MKKTKLAVVLICVVASLCLTACGPCFIVETDSFHWEIPESHR